MRFDGKVLFATGAGSGLGEAVARRFTAEGGRVAVVDLERERTASVVADCDGALGIVADVSDEEAVRAAVADTHSKLGKIHFVLNAAGYAEFHSIEEWPTHSFDQLMKVHLGGTFHVCKHTAPILRGSSGSAIVNVSSIGARFGITGNHAYAAAKGGIISLSRVLAAELAPQIRVNVISPGTFATRLTEPMAMAAGESDLQLGMERMGQKLPLGRVGRPDEFATAACFLFSNEASFITGAILPVDGGSSAVQGPQSGLLLEIPADATS